ncbi:putative MFS family arabinose efflux permease [Gluconobacter cerinus]|uniref:MFS transporter n=1 Tax=Gluconobacter cerinus TaxID=38307 RepID=UPI0022275038|nr:putative MFS family arabinose efflux permease [Gluconobacter cerinus]
MKSSVSAVLDPRIWLLALGTFAIGTDVFVISGILPEVATSLHVDLNGAGQIVTAYALTYALIAPVVVPFTAAFRQTRIVIGTLTVFAIANMLCATTPSYAVLIAARIIAGIVAALYTSTAYSLAASLAPDTRKGAALSAVALGFTGSAVFGVPIGTAIGDILGWRMTFWLVTAVSTLSAIILCLRPPKEPVRHAAVVSIAARFAPLKDPTILLAMLPSVFWNTANLMSYTYLGALLARHHEPRTVVFLFLAYGCGGLAGSQLGGRLVDRFGAIKPLLACLFVATLNQAAMGLSLQTTITTAVTLAIWSVTGWGTFAPQQARLIALAPSNSPLLIAINHSIIYFGTAAGAAMGGALLAHGLPLERLHWVTAAMLAIAVGILGVSAAGSGKGNLLRQKMAGRPS